MSLADRVRAMSNGPVRMSRAAAEAALARAVDKLGLKPRPIRWVRSYAELKKVDGWAPAERAFGAMPSHSPRLIDQRVYDFLNPQNWASATAASIVVSALPSPREWPGFREIWSDVSGESG